VQGTIVSVNSKRRLSKTCTVVWDKTGLKEDFITGFAGEDTLALFKPPGSTQVGNHGTLVCHTRETKGAGEVRMGKNYKRTNESSSVCWQ
jgi:hypothetical protein